MFKVEIEGLDAIMRNLEDLEQRAEALNGERTVTLKDIFSDEFMLLNTDFDSVESMFKARGFAVGSQAEFEATQADQLDAFVAARTRFSSWAEMKARAGEQYMRKRLGL